jgi:hypothetical protein
MNILPKYARHQMVSTHQTLKEATIFSATRKVKEAIQFKS